MDRDNVIKLIYSIVQFLKNDMGASPSSCSNLSEEGMESVEVAVQCLETAYGINQDSTHLSTSKPLDDIFQDYLKNFENGPMPGLLREPTEEEKCESESLKNDGNQFMREEKFDKALECYNKAISKHRSNAVYYCNRAAAYSKLNNHKEAIEDCKTALRIEPQYSKAYGRMGLAYAALDKAKEAKECYQKALELEPENESYRGNLQVAEEKLRTAQTQQTTSGAAPGANPNPFSALGASGFGFGNLAGLSPGAPGSPDLQGLFGNPALMNMATQIMSDPNMQNMMSSFLGNVSGGPGGNAPPPTAPPTGTPSESAPNPPAGGIGMEALLSAGRQLAEQIQSQNPELIEQLRNRMGGPPGSEGRDQDPPNPPQS